jgi:hypothetical protein
MTQTTAAQTTAPARSLAWEDEISAAEAEAEAFEAENLQDPERFIPESQIANPDFEDFGFVADFDEWAERVNDYLRNGDF